LEPTGPLKGIRVIELTNVVAGPTACQILGDFGAEIIKIEHPDGDGLRRQGLTKDGVPLWWKFAGRNKLSVAMYLGHPEAKDVLARLVREADVLLEGFRPGTLERWGIGPDWLEEQNPDLIIGRLSGFGQTGPYSHRPVFGTLVESMSGFAHLTGQPDGPPTLPPLALADHFAGLATVAAVMMALYHRDARDGGAQSIDLAIFDPLQATIGAQIVRHDQLGIIETRTGNRSVNTAPRNVYRTSDDRWVGVASSTEQTAARVVAMAGRPELADEPWFGTGPGRVQHNDLLDEVVGGWIRDHTLTEVRAAAEEFEVVLAPVYNVAEMMEDPQILHRPSIITVEDEDLGPVRMPNVMFKLSRTPGNVRWTGPTKVGGSTDDVLTRVAGYTADEIAELRERGVVA
jgi:crotonobetainyl-CoA:carnitine CoA-transferase CaiB-like acyl-CoA transferase